MTAQRKGRTPHRPKAAPTPNTAYSNILVLGVLSMFTCVRTEFLIILQVDAEDVRAQQDKTFIRMLLTKATCGVGASIKVSSRDSTNPQSLLLVPLLKMEQYDNIKSNSQLCLPKESSPRNKIPPKGRKKGHQRLSNTLIVLV